MTLTETGQNTASCIYDGRDLLYKVTDALGNITEYAYDSNGNLTGIKDANLNTTTYYYDDFDRLIKTVYPDTSDERYLYDTNFNLLSKRTRKGDTINYTYDALNRLVAKIYPDSSQVNYTYDLNGRLISVVGEGLASSRYEYEYDNLNRVISVTNYNGQTQGLSLQYSYDSNGNRTKLTYPDNSSLVYCYDSLNRLTAIKDQTNTVIADYNYDILSRRTGVNLANNTQTTYSYDNLNRLLSVGTKQALSVINDYQYQYDKVGNRLSVTKTTPSIPEGHTSNYTYDNIYQLTGVDYPDTYPFSDSGYNYDNLGNRTSVVNGGTANYIANNLNQYTGIDNGQGQTLQYDQNGNLISDGTWTYGYDYENRLVSATNGITSANYQYDAFGRRTSKRVDESNEVTYLYDGDQIIAEYDGAGVLQRKYVYGLGIDEPIAMISGSNRYFYNQDGLGSISEITGNDGAVIEKYSYDAYGKTVIKDASDTILAQSAIGNRFGFTGREFDAETGLYYYRARVYSPELGRFLQTDPIGYVGGINLYSYCSNNSTNFFDPMGLCKGERSPWGNWYDLVNTDTTLSAIGSWGIGFIEGSWGLINMSNQMMLNPISYSMSTIGAIPKIPANLKAFGQKLTSAEAAPRAIGQLTAHAVVTAITARAIAASAEVASQPTSITGFTKHGIDRVIERGVTPEMLKNTVSNLTNVTKVVDNVGRVSWKFIGEKATVVLNKIGEVITTWPK